MAFVNHGIRPLQPAATKIRGGTKEERTLVRSLSKGTDGRAIKLVIVRRPPPKGWRADRRIEAYGKTWLKIQAHSLGPFQLAAAWKTELVVGAYRDLAHARHLPTVLGYTQVLTSPDDQRRANSQLITGPLKHDVSSASPDELANSLRQRFEEIAEKCAIDRVSVEFIKPLGYAAIIDVTARRPLLAASETATLQSAGLEGWLMRVRDASGRQVAFRSAATRAGAGGSWTR
jgi:hypothetical protein